MATTATRRSKEQAAPAVTFADVARKRMRDRIEQYRASVQRAAAGQQLDAAELEAALEALTTMGLPDYAWDRDVSAQRDYASTVQTLNEAQARRPASEARLTEIVARIRTIEEELKALRSERHTLADVDPMTRVNTQQRLNELALNHPHLFLDVAEAVRLRQEARAKTTGGSVPPAQSISTGAWET